MQVQATLLSPQAPQALQNKSCRHACAGCRHPLPPLGHRRPSLRGLQASLPSSEAPQTLQITDSIHVCVGGRHPCRRRRHRRHGNAWVASILFLVQSSQAWENVGCTHLCLRRRHRKRFKSWVAGMLAWVAGMHVWVAGIANIANHGCRHAYPFGVLKF